MNPIHILLGKLIYFFYNYSIKLVSKYQTHRLTRTEKIMGAGSRINGFGKLSGRDFFSSGKNVHIGNNFFIRAEGGLYIGDNTHISHNVSIYTINHNYKGKRLPYDEDLIKKAVKIEKNVWIGTKVIILPGTHIEEGAIVGAWSSCLRNYQERRNYWSKPC